jgi:phage replication O-like protein O
MSDTAEIYQFPRREDVDRPEPERSGRGPQVEDGYTRIADELYRVINNRHTFPGTATHLRIVHAIIVRTYGFNKTMDEIADTQLAADTGIPRQKINPAKLQLLAMKVLKLSPDGRKIGVNKHHSEWDFSSRPEKKAPQRKGVPNGDTVTKKVTPSVTDLGAHNREIDSLEPKGSKSSSKKKTSPKKWGEEIDHELAEFMHATVTAELTNPKKPNLTAWANDMRLMRTRDGRTVEQIRYLITWVSRDSFWKTNVLCPSKLREKWDQLELKVIAYKESRHANRPGTDAKRANQDRIAAMLSDPNDTSWIEGLFDEESGDLGAGQPGVHPTGGDLSQDMAECVFEPRHGEAGEAGSGYIDGEVVNAADDQKPGHGAGADQGRGQRVATERGAPDRESEASAGGFWNA